MISYLSDKSAGEGVMYGMRSANPPMEYLVMGYPYGKVVNAMEVINNWAHTNEGRFQGLPPLKEVKFIKYVKDMVEGDNQHIIFGRPWDQYPFRSGGE